MNFVDRSFVQSARSLKVRWIGNWNSIFPEKQFLFDCRSRTQEKKQNYLQICRKTNTEFRIFRPLFSNLLGMFSHKIVISNPFWLMVASAEELKCLFASYRKLIAAFVMFQFIYENMKMETSVTWKLKIWFVKFFLQLNL